jgi:hypothetical protein
MLYCVMVLCSFWDRYNLEAVAIYSFETSVTVYGTEWRHNPEEGDTDFHCNKSIKFHKYLFTSIEKCSHVNKFMW